MSMGDTNSSAPTAVLQCPPLKEAGDSKFC